MMTRKFRAETESHSATNFSYLDMFEEQVQSQRAAYEAFEQNKVIEEGDNESKKPAFFQKDSKLEAAKMELQK